MRAWGQVTLTTQIPTSKGSGGYLQLRLALPSRSAGIGTFFPYTVVSYPRTKAAHPGSRGGPRRTWGWLQPV